MGAALSIAFPPDAEARQALAREACFDTVYVTGERAIAAPEAALFRSFPALRELQIWCGITRAALAQAMRCPGLRSLVIQELRPGGRLDDLGDLADLACFECQSGLTGHDIVEIATLPGLTRLGAQRASLSEEAVVAVARAGALRELDLEGSDFDDSHARILARSGTIERLEIGATRTTRAGLEHLASMRRLTGLDLWNTRIVEADLDRLAPLQALEYLSIGGPEGQTVFTPGGSVPRLARLGALRRIWLDGVRVSRREWEDLAARYDEVRVSAIHDD